ncbi:hypothetical protein K493DRAFT_278898 [Basidiobolus meristosporus CBS 931.73]|uniref:Eukaryotic translation initiation factor 3 subunit A n=1 Tax=Basidiobolus meristosporus CBS 931.73 TaxID=1314790 RepID=A0A1Y1YQG0_9FUNG|nr:hypothetical protein K493DRAFT_278898 [Basidiobolus meristosporus CBS 931.73]|eukprot:ORY00263.1 hypothetical protein K493DRAFT_278898 [Basidiobolus meristosporus CBS 931.73]
MAPFYQKPENAYKRAEELIAVGQHNAALQSLHDVLTSKRSRHVVLSSLEPVAMKFIELCVELRKGRLAKEGLHQYKNIAQNTNIDTIENVITKYIELAESKVQEAQAKADQITLDAIEDLEATETPESMMMGIVSGEQSKDRTDRAVVTPWLKFLWETYRNVLDILRNNARLEVMYQTTVNQAFQFCLRYTRKTEFRRLCELLRNHLGNVAKYSHQPHAINLNEPESLQRHLDSRFAQLNASVELELWQEAFRSIEDIHTLLTMSRRMPKPIMMANYYNKLIRILMVSENYLFHAAAWNKFYSISKTRPMSDEEHQKMASFVLLSALAVPVVTAKPEGNQKSKIYRLTNLMGLARPPTRAGLLKDALSEDVLKWVRPELRELYNILEVQFHPLSICKKIAPIMTELAASNEERKYVEPLHQVILSRLLQQLSQIYTTIKLDYVVKLASFEPPFDYDATTIEKFIMAGCKKGELSIRIDHATRTINFEQDPFQSTNNNIVDGVKLQPMPSDLVRNQLTSLAKCLYSTSFMIDPSLVEAKKEAKREAFARALAGVEQEHKDTLARKAIIERRKEIVETLLIRKEKEEAREKAIRMQQEQEAEKLRIAEETKKREIERVRREHEAIQREEARKLAESLKAKSGLNVNVDDIENLDTNKLMAMQVEQLEKEKNETQNRLKAIAKRMDHLERAFRKEEIPLLEQDYERQRKADRTYYEAARTVKLEAASRKHAEDLKIKTRMQRLMSDYASYKQSLQSKREAELQEKRKAAQAKIDEEKQARIQEYRRLKEEEENRARAIEEARRAKEAEEARKLEEKSRLEAERAERAAKDKVEYEARMKKLEEQAEKQRERERLAEEKIARSKAGGDRYVPPSQRDQSAGNPWRRSGAPAAAPAASAPESRPTGPAPSLFGAKQGGWRERMAAKQAQEKKE